MPLLKKVVDPLESRTCMAIWIYGSADLGVSVLTQEKTVLYALYNLGAQKRIASLLKQIVWCLKGKDILMQLILAQGDPAQIHHPRKRLAEQISNDRIFGKQ